MPVWPNPLSRRRGAAVALAALLATTACTGDTQDPHDDAAAYVDGYVATYEAAGKVIDAIDASDSWRLVRDAESFNTYARWDDHSRYQMKSFGEDDGVGVVSFCVLDVVNDVYAAVAATAAPTDPAETVYTLGFGPGTTCAADVTADVAIAISGTDILPIENGSERTSRVADALRRQYREGPAFSPEDGTSGEVVVRYAALDLAEDLAEMARKGNLPTRLTEDDLIARRIALPRGTTLPQYQTTPSSGVTFCVLHRASQASAEYTTADLAKPGTVVVKGPGEQLCGLIPN